MTIQFNLVILFNVFQRTFNVYERSYTPMVDVISRVLGLMKERGITSYRVCKDNNIPHASFLQIKRGTQQFRLDQILSLADYFNIDIKYLLSEEKNDYLIRDENYINKTFQKIPIVGTVGCGAALKNWENYGDTFLELPDTRHLKNPFIVIAKGDSMSPYINPNDKLLCSDAPELIKDKRAVIVCFKTEPETSDANAKLIKFLKHDMIMLYSVNTRYEPIICYKDEIYKIYKLMRIIREVK